MHAVIEHATAHARHVCVERCLPVHMTDLPLCIFDVNKVGDGREWTGERGAERRLDRDPDGADLGVEGKGVKVSIKEDARILGSVGSVPEHRGVGACGALAVGKAIPQGARDVCPCPVLVRYERLQAAVEVSAGDLQQVRQGGVCVCVCVCFVEI